MHTIQVRSLAVAAVNLGIAIILCACSRSTSANRHPPGMGVPGKAGSTAMRGGQSPGEQSKFSLEVLNNNLPQLTKEGATVEQVVAFLGEPYRYSFGPYTYTKDHLPDKYILWYPEGVSILASHGKVMEFRSITPGTGFTWKGKLHLGSTLDEVLQVVGPPTTTLVGKQVGQYAGVLYKDIDGIAGYCHYDRPDQKARFSFLDYKINAMFVTVNTEEQTVAASQPKPINRLVEFQHVCGHDLSQVDFSEQPEVAFTLWFNEKTVWPKALPKGFEPAKVLAAGMNPGLGIRGLHHDGLTGKGVNVAIIDQPFAKDHPEFLGKIAAYHEVTTSSAFYGAAVVSMLAGAQCGTAPGARVYFAAVPPAWTGDAGYWAKALDWVLEKNAELPAQEKIKLVCVSQSPSAEGLFKKDTELYEAACERAAKAGIMVLDGTRKRSFTGPCFYDPNDPENVAKCKPGSRQKPGFWGNPGALLVPCSARTFPEAYAPGQSGYQFCAQQNTYWTLPYCGGVLALGWQVRPNLGPAQMHELLIKSAYRSDEGAVIINPPEFIRMVKAAPKAR